MDRAGRFRKWAGPFSLTFNINKENQNMTTRDNTKIRNKKTESKAVNTDITTDGISKRSVKTSEPPKQESNIFAEPQPELTAKADQNLSYLYYDSPYVGDDGVFRPLLCTTKNILTKRGVTIGHIKAALLTSLAINSARLKYPLSVLLMAQNPLLAVNTLDHCVRLAPPNSTIEFQEMKPEHLILGAKDFRDRTVISADPNGFRKVNKDIEMLLTRGFTVKQETVKSKYEVNIEERRTDWPIAFVGISNGQRKGNIDHPLILRVPLDEEVKTTGEKSGFGDVIFSESDTLQVEIARAKKTFERLMPQRVDIPYFSQLWDHLLKVNTEHPEAKALALGNVISICTIINNPMPIYQDELFAEMYRIERQKVNKWLVEIGHKSHQNYIDVQEAAPLIATKVDYYLAWLLLDGILLNEDSFLATRQRRIYESVCRINTEKVKQAMLKKGDEIEILSTISQSSVYWTRREKIYEMVNNDGGQYLSLSIVNNELIDLMKMGIVDRSKPQKSRHFGYYVMTLNSGKAISLPPPSEINDPIYEGKPVSVMNPLTGKTEKI